jgi:transposase
VGSKGPVTETGEAATPHVIVNVEPTPATPPADHLVKPVQVSLEHRPWLPAEPLVDKGSPDSQVLVESQQTYAVTLLGPVAADPRGQARAGAGCDTARFLVEWERQVVTCPLGQERIAWLPNTSPKNGMPGAVRFARKAQG